MIKGCGLKVATIALGLGLTACATFRHEPIVTVLLTAEDLPPSSATDQKARLLQEIKDRPERAEAMRDILLALEAEEFESAERWQEAADKWRQVLQIDKGAVAAEAFERWTVAEGKSLGSGATPTVLARLLLEGAGASPWLKKEGLTSEAALLKRLDGMHWPNKLEVAAAAPKLTDKPGSIPNDPLWEKASRAACGRDLPPAWKQWVASLKGGNRLYWNALQENCSGLGVKAAGDLRQAIPLLQSNRTDLPRALRSAELMIQIYKSVGDREATTAAYQMQYELLKRSDLPLDALGWTAFEKSKRQIEAAYWVGRNLALQGDYENAKVATQEGLTTVEALPTEGLAKKDRSAVDELKADGYHILASRIAYEQKDMAAAQNYTKSAQSIAGLSLDWQQRLTWAQGWYAYSAGDRDGAIAAWNIFLKAAKDDSSRSKAWYWIGRAAWEKGDKDLAEKSFESLQKRNPLSFYAVIGISAIDPGHDWRKGFARPSSLADDLQDVSEFNSEAYAKDAEVSRRLLRLEIAVAAKLQSWTKDLAWELFRYASTKKALMKDLEASLFVSRVLHMSGQYLLSISMTTSLLEMHDNVWKDYPEQILVFFPQPFGGSVDRAATQNQIDRELILAISRQESSFRPDAESAVGALGLMQLMPATAKQQGQKIGLAFENVGSALRQPDVNIQLGSLYLADLGRRYNLQWPKAFAAYNAGEYATDAWVQRRSGSDLLAWSEALSFGETSGYVKNVWRNWEVYNWLAGRPRVSEQLTGRYSAKALLYGKTP